MDIFAVKDLSYVNPILRRKLGIQSSEVAPRGPLAAVIIETRKSILLKPITLHNMKMLGKDWRLFVLHGTDNDQFVRDALGSCKNVEFLSIDVPRLDDYSYNNLVKNYSTWQYFQSQGVEKVLLFQLDAVLLRRDIDTFLKWDYIGAPWKKTNDIYTGRNEVGVQIPALPAHIRVGNGGLSVRSVKAMASIAQKGLLTSPEEQEDVFFARNLHEYNYNVADTQSAVDFSLEVVLPERKIAKLPFGLHQAWLYEKNKKKKPSIALVSKMLVAVYGETPAILSHARHQLFLSGVTL